MASWRKIAVKVPFIQNRQNREVGYLLVAAFLFHGFLIPWLGFYWDDWTPVLAAHMPHTSWCTFFGAFEGNRPISGVWLWMGMSLLGARPWAWHTLSVVLRWLIGWQSAKLTARVWPKRPTLSLLVGLFAVAYPGFRLHPVAVAFTPHLSALALMLFSFNALWDGWYASRRLGRWGWWVASWLSLSVALLLIEYFIGLEAARWLLVVHLLRRSSLISRERRKRLLFYGLPYLLVLGLTITLVRFWSRPPEFSFAPLLRFPGWLVHSVFYVTLKGWFADLVWNTTNWKSRRTYALMLTTGGLAYPKAGIAEFWQKEFSDI